MYFSHSKTTIPLTQFLTINHLDVFINIDCYQNIFHSSTLVKYLLIISLHTLDLSSNPPINDGYLCLLASISSGFIHRFEA